MEKILVINPGSASTKLACYDGDREVWHESIAHDHSELKRFAHVCDQLDFRYDLLLKDYLRLVEEYAGDPLVFDTTEVMLKEVWLVYPDGHEALFEQGCEDFSKAEGRVMSGSFGVRGNMLITEYEQVDDSTMVPHEYCLERLNPLANMLGSMEEMMDKMSGFRIEYRDARKATLIVVK